MSRICTCNKRSKRKLPSRAVGQYGQILLHQHEGGDGSLINLAPTFLVIYAQRVSISGAIGLAIDGAPLTVGRLHGDPAAEEGTGGHLDLAGVRQALRGLR